MRLVLDTALLVAAIRSSQGASRYMMEAGLQQRFTMLVSVPLLIEYEAVMTRREQLLASGLNVREIEDLLDAVAAQSDPIHLSYSWRPMLPDANDDMVLETAINGDADAIVTFNRRDFAIVKSKFGIAIWSPAEAVRRLE